MGRGKRAATVQGVLMLMNPVVLKLDSCDT